MHKYEVKGTYIFTTTIESEKPRNEMLDVYAPIVNSDSARVEAIFVKGECTEVFECHSCSKNHLPSDKYCRNCGAKLE